LRHREDIMAGRTPKRLVAVIALVIGLGALAPATAADAKTSVKPPAKSTTPPTTVVVTPMDWWF